MEEKFKDKKINKTLTRVNVNLNIAWEHFFFFAHIPPSSNKNHKMSPL